MGDKMEHSLVNPNQMRLFGIAVQDNPVCKSPLYLTTEDGDFVLPLQMKGTNVMANTRAPTAKSCMIAPTLFCRPSILGIHIA